MKTKKLVVIAFFAALTCVATFVIKIPSPTGGYYNLGDCIVLISAYMLGPYYGAISSGIGSMFADLISGAPQYAGATLIIKGLVALAAGFMFNHLKLKTPMRQITAGIIGEIIMVLGYFGFTVLMLDSQVEPALVSMLGDTGQALVGIATSTILYEVLRRNKSIKDIMNF
ncbi:MAG: ECF transporter S component [Bacillota bacterium]|nr:ECF transporter S component [Bacillota bacterium]